LLIWLKACSTRRLAKGEVLKGLHLDMYHGTLTFIYRAETCSTRRVATGEAMKGLRLDIYNK
jgi:hypothetical protein